MPGDGPGLFVFIFEARYENWFALGSCCDELFFLSVLVEGNQAIRGR
jgi:hypothetical protein